MGKTNGADSEEKELLLSAVNINIFYRDCCKTTILQQFFFAKKFRRKMKRLLTHMC